MNLPNDILFPSRYVSEAECRVIDLMGARRLTPQAWYIADDGERLTCGALFHDDWARARTGITDGRAAHDELNRRGYIPVSEPLGIDFSWQVYVDEKASGAAISELRAWMHEHFDCNPDFPILVNGMEAHSFVEFSRLLADLREKSNRSGCGEGVDAPSCRS